jgi:hypothetical protein
MMVGMEGERSTHACTHQNRYSSTSTRIAHTTLKHFVVGSHGRCFSQTFSSSLSAPSVSSSAPKSISSLSSSSFSFSSPSRMLSLLSSSWLASCVPESSSCGKCRHFMGSSYVYIIQRRICEAVSKKQQIYKRVDKTDRLRVLWPPSTHCRSTDAHSVSWQDVRGAFVVRISIFFMSSK